MLRKPSPRPIFLAAAMSALAALPVAAEMISKDSPHSVTDTIDRLEAAVKGAGAAVIARVDHAGSAKSADLELKPSQVLIFGNPQIGTPAMQEAMTAGLDLPLRVLAYEDADGAVHIVYHDTADLVETHGLTADAEYLTKMSGALDKLTSKAVAAE